MLEFNPCWMGGAELGSGGTHRERDGSFSAGLRVLAAGKNLTIDLQTMQICHGRH